MNTNDLILNDLMLRTDQSFPPSLEKYQKMKSALEFIAAQSDLVFAECSVAEEIVGRAREALK